MMRRSTGYPAINQFKLKSNLHYSKSGTRGGV